MSRNIRIELDWNCFSADKEKENILGGTEILMLKLSQWLIEEGYEVDRGKNPKLKEYDLIIFSNSMPEYYPNAKKKLVFAGSTHSDAGFREYDEVVNVSEHMKNITGRGVIIPAFVGDDVKPENAVNFFPERIFCSANPSKFYEHFPEYINKLSLKKVFWTFRHSGGNKLYNGKLPEIFTPMNDTRIQYLGILKRHDLIRELSGSHVFVLPAFSSDAMTFEVSPLEALKLGLTTILPNRSPFTEIHRPIGAILCDTIDDMVNWTVVALREKRRIEYDVSKYSEENVKCQWINLIRSLV